MIWLLLTYNVISAAALSRHKAKVLSVVVEAVTGLGAASLPEMILQRLA